MPSRILFALILAFSAPALVAQTELPGKVLTDKTSTGLGKLGPLLEAKDYAGALTLVESLSPDAPAGTFDVYILTQLKAQILLTQNKLVEAIVPMETTLKMAEANSNFADQAAILDQINVLSQLYYQKAAEAKGAAQKEGYEIALKYIERWLALNPKPTFDGRLFAASLLYQIGATDPANLDKAKLRAAIAQGREAMLLSVTPSAQIVQILVACHLQLGENAQAADYLETLALRDPKNSSTWSQLLSIYMAIAGDTKDTQEARSNSLRAFITLDRAQEQGLMKTPRDNYTRVAILFNIQEYSRAAALMEKGLTDKSIEGTKRNWELLASAYQQISQDEKALSALSRATAQFPADAALEFSLAQFLYNTGNTTEAYKRAQAAFAKGLEKPGQSQVYLAYLAFELQRYEDAKKWIDAARASGEVPPETVNPLDKAISDSLRTRESIKTS